MFALIFGGSGSGKSEYAEGLAVSLSAGDGTSLYYIATMIPYGEEGQRRVERHRRLRQGKGFETIECYTDLKNLVLPPRSTVLLECMSNLTANELFEEHGAKNRTADEILKGIGVLRASCTHLVVVTNDVFSDGILYEEATEQYLRCLGEINRRLADQADQVTEVVCGIPILPGEERRKGSHGTAVEQL